MATARTTDNSPRRARPRRDLASGAPEPRGVLVRFVVGPDRAIVPDVAGQLPGRGLWLSPRRDVLKMAAAGRGRVFSRAAGGAVAVPQELDRLVERLLVERIVNLIGLARRSGSAVCGFERVREALAAMKPAGHGAAVLLIAGDASAPDRSRLKASAVDVVTSETLTADELGAAFGREDVVFAVVSPGRLATEIEAQAGKLALLRAEDGSLRPVSNRVKDGSAR